MLDRATLQKVDEYAQTMGTWMPPQRHVVESVPVAVVKGTDSKPQGADGGVDYHRNAPQPDPQCLYGLIGDIARAGSQGSEANPYAIAAAAIAYLCSAIGRGPFLAIGDDWHHSRVFLAHVGRSGRGRKGTSVKLVKRIAHAVARQSPCLAPQIHDGGLSSREGLVQLIHDGYTEGKEEVPAIEDKRLWVIESEMANLLQQGRRMGNTLSAALRDCWDGVSIKPAIKNSPVWVTDPHVCILANITPTELRDLMSSRELSNGFANRILFIWAEQTRIEPFPVATPNDVVENLAQRVIEVLLFAGAERHVERDVLEVKLDKGSPAAQVYEHLYRTELRDLSAGERVTGLLERAAPMLLRLAMLFALTDRTTQINEAHIRAAMAWIRYWKASVQFVFQTAQDELEQEKVAEASQKIVAWLKVRGPSTRTEISRDCFKGHAPKDVLDEALDQLLTNTPPAIEVVELARPDNKPGARAKRYQLLANSANSANFVVHQGLEHPNTGQAQVRNQRTETPQSLPEPAIVRKVSTTYEAQKASQAIEIKQNSPVSQSTHANRVALDQPETDDGEMF